MVVCLGGSPVVKTYAEKEAMPVATGYSYTNDEDSLSECRLESVCVYLLVSLIWRSFSIY